MNWTLYLWCVLGVTISIVLPILAAAVRVYWPAQRAGPAGLGADAKRFWPVVRPYIVLGLFSALTGIVVLFALGDQLKTIQTALLAGYAWDSTLQKLTKS